MEKANNTQNEQIVKSYVRHKKAAEQPVPAGHKYFALGTLVYFLLLMARYQPTLFSALVLSVASGFAYKYWNDHRVIVYDDIAGEPEPVHVAKRRYRKKSDYLEVYRDNKLEQIIYKGNA